MSTHTLQGANSSPSPEESLIGALLSSSSPFDIKSIQLVTSSDQVLSLKVLLCLPGETRWRMISTPGMQPSRALFLAHGLIDHHAHYFPQRKEILDRWSEMLDDSSTPYIGISLIMGMS